MTDDLDDLEFTSPKKPSDLAAMTDEELLTLLRKVSFANSWHLDAKMRHEVAVRQVIALREFQASAGRSSDTIERLTRWLIVLTGVIVALTITLIVLDVTR